MVLQHKNTGTRWKEITMDSSSNRLGGEMNLSMKAWCELQDTEGQFIIHTFDVAMTFKIVEAQPLSLLEELMNGMLKRSSTFVRGRRTNKCSRNTSVRDARFRHDIIMRKHCQHSS